MNFESNKEMESVVAGPSRLEVETETARLDKFSFGRGNTVRATARVLFVSLLFQCVKIVLAKKRF